jgi:hypothetical protein
LRILLTFPSTKTRKTASQPTGDEPGDNNIQDGETWARQLHAKYHKVEAFEASDQSIYALNKILEIARPSVDIPRHPGSALLEWIVIICPDAARAAPGGATTNADRLRRSHTSGGTAGPECRS